MALVLKDRVRESSTTSGTGSITLDGALPGYQTFATAVTNGSTVYYTIHNTTAPNDTEWEVGVGTFTSPSTLSRDTVFSSSAGGAKVSFSSASTLDVFITQPSEQAIYINDATGKIEASGNGSNTIAFTNINASNVVMVSGTISTNAANATDITNKTYVDGLFSTGISYHSPVRVESPTNLNATYNNGASGVGATLTNAGTQAALVLDGVTLSLNDRVLIYTQTNQVQNGIYTVTNVGSGSTNWVLTRATDANSYGLADPNKLGQGDAVFVQQGNTGAGETYVCNTAGTITFGTTNITFAQISTSQIYSAGTGLNLSNLTFSIANTAVTAGTYGDAGTVGTFTVNAQGQLTSASNAAINASSITLGTLANARTTASDANGASTIVSRDANGSFAANVVTATSGSFTNVSGNGSALTAINASNISSGTIANARTTGSTSNSASTIVLRDANGSFGANIISGSFSGDGSAINAINASNISSGTIANARTTAASANGASTIVQRDSGGNFSANTVTAAVIGDISGGSAINASNISSGTIANARTTASSSNGASTIVLRDAGGAFAAGAITGTSFSGNGASITAINASAITTGTIDNARTTASSANGASTIVSRDSGGNFSANTITANLTGTASSATTAVTVTQAAQANITSVGTLTNVTTSGTYKRSAAGKGYLDGGYNSVETVLTSGCIYTIGGSSYNPTDTTLGTMYGIGYGYSGNAGITATGAPASKWGMYVASGGTSRIFLNSDDGIGYFNGAIYSGGTQVVTNTGTWGINISGSAASATTASNTTSISSAVGNGYTWTGTQYFQSNANTGSSSGVPLQAYSSSGGAIMAFHRAGVYAVNMGLDSDNVFRIGGWSASANLLQMDMSGNLTMAGNVTAYSDERLKKNWKNLSPVFVKELSKVKSGVYERTDKEITQVGVSAQSLQKILPEAVLEDASGHLSVAYGSAALAACVELAKEVVKLREELDALKGK